MKSVWLIPVCFSCRNTLHFHPPSLPHEWVGQARCIWPPLHWPCSQAARLPVPDGDDSRPRSDFLPQCNCSCVVCVRMCARTVNLRCVIPFLTHIVFIPFCLFCLCTCVCMCALFKKDLFLFVTCLHISHIYCFCWGLDFFFRQFAVKCKI